MDQKATKRAGFIAAARRAAHTARQRYEEFHAGYEAGRDAITKLQAVRNGSLSSASRHPVLEIIHEDDIAAAQFAAFHRSQASRTAYDAGHALTHILFKILASGLE